MKTLLLTISVIMMMAICAYADWPPGGVNWGGGFNFLWHYWSVVPDGQGGFWAVWQDAEWDIRYQHMDNDGNMMFDYPGPKIIDDANYQANPEACSDREGGMIFAFKDYRHSGSPDIYAQRIGRNGEELWEHNGIPVFVDPLVEDYDQKLELLSDGSVVVTWKHAINWPHGHILAQRVDSTGNILWGSTGVLIIGDDITQPWDPGISVDSMDNIFITWVDHTEDSLLGGIWNQKLDIGGSKFWGESGTRACYGLTEILRFDYYSATIDGHGGLLIAWYDVRYYDGNVFAAWVDSTGTSRWGLDGISITYPIGGAETIIEYDGYDGAMLSWAGFTDEQRAQRIRIGSSENALQWEDGGKVVALGVGGKPVSLFSAGNGEWILGFRGHGQGISQKFDSAGTRIWGDTGKNIWPDMVENYEAVTDNEGGAIAISNSYINQHYSYYAQRIDSAGHYSGETGIDEEGQQSPSSFSLSTPYPNPFNSATIIEFNLAQNARISINIYNILGEEVLTLIDGLYPAGRHSVEWKGTDLSGDQLSSGIYFIKLESKTALGISDIKKAILVK